MERRNFLKAFAGAFAGTAALGGQVFDSARPLIVTARCDCGWEVKHPFKKNEHGFYFATEALCPKCLNLLSQTIEYEDNPEVKVLEEQQKAAKATEQKQKEDISRRKLQKEKRQRQERQALQNLERRLAVQSDKKCSTPAKN